jgi:hypothetical protein
LTAGIDMSQFDRRICGPRQVDSARHALRLGDWFAVSAVRRKHIAIINETPRLPPTCGVCSIVPWPLDNMNFRISTEKGNIWRLNFVSPSS